MKKIYQNLVWIKLQTVNSFVNKKINKQNENVSLTFCYLFIGLKDRNYFFILRMSLLTEISEGFYELTNVNWIVDFATTYLFQMTVLYLKSIHHGKS